jgi:hypothetical protein
MARGVGSVKFTSSLTESELAGAAASASCVTPDAPLSPHPSKAVAVDRTRASTTIHLEFCMRLPPEFLCGFLSERCLLSAQSRCVNSRHLLSICSDAYAAGAALRYVSYRTALTFCSVSEQHSASAVRSSRNFTSFPSTRSTCGGTSASGPRRAPHSTRWNQPP